MVILAGVVLMVSFERAFERAGTDANPYRPSTALATDGPYRFSRNLAYLGMAITYIGITLATEAPWALVMLVPANPPHAIRGGDPARGALPRRTVRRRVPELQADDSALDLRRSPSSRWRRS